LKGSYCSPSKEGKMDAKTIEELLRKRYPQSKFKVEFLPFGNDSKVLVIRTDLYNDRRDEIEKEIKKLLRKYGIEIRFYRDLRTGAITTGLFAFILVGPLKGEGANE
jgi:hypothetical protein